MKKILVVFFMVAGLAGATPFIAFTNPDQIGAAGDLLSFEVTLTNPGGGASVFLNGDSINIGSPLSLNDLFFTNSPIFLNSPDSSAFTLFTISIPGVIAPGIYQGTATILGGIDVDAQDNLGQADFSVTIPAVPAPEPSTLIIGAPLLLWFAGRLWSKVRSV